MSTDTSIATAATTVKHVTGIENPYDVLLRETFDDPKEIQARYENHRIKRIEQQKEKLLDAAFEGLALDTILQRLLDPLIEPGFVDPRHSITVWARPTKKVKELAVIIQERLLSVAPNLWVMPAPDMHTTVMEIAHSRTAPEIEAVLADGARAIAPEIVKLTHEHHVPRLIKPILGYDAAAIALTFAPAAGECLANSRRTLVDDGYTYHHLRRDVYAMCAEAGVRIESRYALPSAHITLARFVSKADTDREDGSGLDTNKMKKLIEAIEDINDWLRREYWPSENGDDGKIKEGGEWIVGKEQGLIVQAGKVWYGGGSAVAVGRGSRHARYLEWSDDSPVIS